MVTLSFMQALVLARSGAAIRRSGWNGKGMWVAVHQGWVTDFSGFQLGDPATRVLTSEFTTDTTNENIDVLPFMVMRTADRKFVFGWLASQTDMLADDWEVVEVA